MSKENKQKLDRAIFDYFQGRQTESEKQKVLDLAGGKISEAKLKEILGSHYYLSPQNLTSAQLLLAFLSVLLTLALVIVRISADWKSFIMAAVIGVSISIPYGILYFLFKRFKQLNTYRALAWFGFIYTIIMALLFISISLQLGLTGVVLIPILIVVLYYIEIRKLGILLAQLGMGKN